MIKHIGSKRRFTTDDEALRLDASGIVDQWKGLTATVSVYSDAEGFAGFITTERLAIVDGGARRQFANRLAGHPNAKRLGISAESWAQVVEDACHQLLADHASVDAPVSLDGAYPDATDERHLFAPLLLGGAVPTSLFGEGGSGKSWVALAIAVSVASGRSAVARIEAPARRVPVLWLDFENDERELRSRVARLTDGAPLEGLHYLRGSGALAKQVDAIAELITDLGVGLLVVDSITGATGGAPLNDDATATSLHGALRQLGIPTLLIAHTAKNSKTGGIFGAVAFRDLSRLVWSVEKSDEASNYILLKDTKRNGTAKSDDLVLHIDFAPGEGLVRLSRSDTQSLPAELNSRLTVRQQVMNALRGESLTREQLAELVDAKANTLNTTLRRMAAEAS
jgi:hypothetical protein